jgi:hypothetical protein
MTATTEPTAVADYTAGPKDYRCPSWCVADHSKSENDGYLCMSGDMVLKLPFTTEVCGRSKSGDRIALNLGQWTVEDTIGDIIFEQTGVSDLSSSISLEITIGGGGVGLSRDEVRMLIGMLSLHVEAMDR